MMKIGIESAGYIEHYGLREGLRRMKAQGYETLDYQTLADTETSLYTCSEAEYTKKLIEVRNECAAAGIEISQTHGPWRWPPQDYTEEQRAERFEKMVKAIRGTAILGCPYMVIHSILPFGDDKDPDPERLWSMNYEFMGRLADAGREYGVIVCHENMPMLALSNSTPEAILKFVRTLNHPNFKICLDTGHCAVFGLSVGDAVRMTGKELLRVLHVHDNDGHGDRHWLPYTGVIDWDDFSNALEEIGFEGSLSLETHIPNSVPDGAEREAAENKLFLDAKRLARR